jgi:hypothetical protein
LFVVTLGVSRVVSCGRRDNILAQRTWCRGCSQKPRHSRNSLVSHGAGRTCETQREVIEVELSPEERSLILRYGYPFDRIKQALATWQKSRTIEIVPLDKFELERLIGDLSKSINDMAGGSLQNALFDLYERLEAAERYGSGMLYEF